METELIEKLFLELSQFTKARTAKEIELRAALCRCKRLFDELDPDEPIVIEKYDDMSREIKRLLIET